jgi:hypothetical protein
LDHDLDDELRSHLEMRAADNVTAGMSAEEARFAAQRRFGNSTLIKEDTRAMDIVGSLETLGRNSCCSRGRRCWLVSFRRAGRRVWIR